ncbi:T9SS type A sorting domain-containing protein [Algibacter sp. L3A6]|uniref:galactose-binding domain-containing protein n=1 Tax=Algibacter sp. L3A6 TaxID=2686366 RepID=UPI00131C6723|nr:T9SS type A sorting domain-containing protein [Algibacter sp. L3A6]
MKKLFIVILVVLAFLPTNAQEEPNASWMSGSWGIWYQVGGSIRTDTNTENIYLEGAQQIVDELPTMGHVFSSFTHSAHGYYFMLRDNPYVDVATEIHPDFVPSIENEEKFLEVLDVFKKAGKKIILYVATDGPSARGGTPDNEEYKLAWETYYNREFGGDEGLAWRTVCKGYFERFKGIADGYWLDHTNQLPGGMAAYEAMIRSVDSTVSLATNTVVESDTEDFLGYFTYSNGDYILVDSDGLDDPDSTDYKIKKYEITDPYMDFTGGHPTPLQQGAPPNSFGYEEYTFPDMIAEPWGTFDGSKNALKHAFVPMRERWSVASVDLVFKDEEQAYRVVRNLTDVGCAMTFSTTYTLGMMSEDELTVLKEVDARLGTVPMPDFIPYTRPAGAKLVGETFPASYQYIVFPELSTKTVGNAGFDPEISATSGLPVTISSSNTEVAVVIKNKIHVVGAGYTLITASQAGNSEYDMALDVTRRLTVIGENIGGTNVALTGIASQSSTAFTALAERAIDGNTDGAFSKQSVTHTETEMNAWWQVDLGVSYNIGQISLYSRTDDCCKDRVTDFTVYVLDADSVVTYSKYFADSPYPSITMDAGGVIGKTVKVQLNGSGSMSLAEVVVYDVPNSVSFSVTDELTGDGISYASLAINDRYYFTNAEGNVQAQMPAGSFPLVISKEGYHTLTQNVEILSDTSIALQLIPSALANLNSPITDKIRIYPNPVSEIMNVEYADTETVIMNVIDLTGHIIISTTIQSGITPVDISDLSPGFYIVRISNEDKTYLRKIIKM